MMIQHRGTQTIETERLTLRRFTLADADAMFDRWANDPRVTRYVTWPPHGSAEVTKQVLSSWIADYARPDNYQWAIVLKELDDKPIGSIGVVHVKESVGEAEIGYCMSAAHWGRGIMTEALAAVLAHLFDAGFQRIQAAYDVENPASGAVMRKCGMEYEGTHRKAIRNQRGIVDVAVYAVLR